MPIASSPELPATTLNVSVVVAYRPIPSWLIITVTLSVVRSKIGLVPGIQVHSMSMRERVRRGNLDQTCYRGSSSE